jgi:lipopolysaccharide/colanic/teichoic acid biosynthesis glycosyltransferase
VDIVIASAGLAVTAPVLALAAVAIKLEDRGPALFRQRRYGRDQQPFTMLKLRTMTVGASSALHEAYIAELMAGPQPATDGELYKLTEDPRVTRVGRWLRRLSLDEVPQLINVLLGDMAVVGPRPGLAYELEHYAPEHFDRFTVRPGLTGLWQVSGRSKLGFREMLDLDVEYTRRRSVSLDLLIILRTPLAIARPAA